LAKDNLSLVAFNEITMSKTEPFITAVKVADGTVEIGQTQSDYRHLAVGRRESGFTSQVQRSAPSIFQPNESVTGADILRFGRSTQITTIRAIN
jgi:hypothetical protein